MADDLDAELLALAGDSDEESSPPSKQKPTSPSASPDPHSPEPSSATMGRKGTAKPVRRGRKVRRASEEDGELYVAISSHLYLTFRCINPQLQVASMAVSH